MYDCIVIGFGGIGSAALYHAAKKGWNVLGIDRFGVAHARGSSHGQTRIIRAAYYEHPDYVPLAQRAFERWDDLQQTCSQDLIKRTGLLQVGDPDGELVEGIQTSASRYGLEVQTWSTAEAMKRFPILRLRDGHIAIFEKSAGLLRVERCIANFIKLSKTLGAETSTDDQVVGWDANDDDSFSVTTECGQRYQSRRLIVAGGPWSEELLGLSFGFRIVRKQQHWFQIDRIDHKLQHGFPCFLFESDAGCFYGFPELDNLGMKIAEHTGGSIVTDPTNVDRSLDEAERQESEEFLSSHFHFTRKRLVHHSICMYTKSQDEHFVIDHHPVHSQLVFAAGLSGHGFKFSPLIGKRLIEMLDGQDDPLFDFFRLAARQN